MGPKSLAGFLESNLSIVAKLTFQAELSAILQVQLGGS
jgi:hypothetical protein